MLKINAECINLQLKKDRKAIKSGKVFKKSTQNPFFCPKSLKDHVETIQKFVFCPQNSEDQSKNIQKIVENLKYQQTFIRSSRNHSKIEESCSKITQ
jgi:hypoxanthine phosphoribosyltransferase